MNDVYSPHTGEHIITDNPAPWMGRAGVECPAYDPQAESAYWRDGHWAIETAAPDVVVPELVSRAQGKAALIQAGLWGQVEAYVEGIQDETDKALARVALDDTQEWRRDSPFLNQAAQALGISEAQMDALFVAAAQIVF